jgi:predicted amidohydrolase
MSGTVTIGIAQWRAHCGEPDRNLHDALGFVAELARQGCDVAVLPELWPCGYDAATVGRDARGAAEPLDGPRGRALSAAAGSHGVWLFGGTVPERDGTALYNTAVVYGPDGELHAAHRKVYLYTPLGEDDVFTAGKEATVLDVAGIGPVGISTCFDGDHPSYARELHDRGARLVVAPCAYEVATESWWDILYPANALANGQWWVLANQCGGELLGKSRIIAPDGTIAAQARRVGDGADTELLVARLDLGAGVRAAEIAAGALWAEPAGWPPPFATSRKESPARR